MSETKSIEGGIPNITGNFHLYFEFKLVSDIQSSAASTYAASEAWASVTCDDSFVQHLMDFYFCWSAPLHVLFSKEMLLREAKRRLLE